MNAKVLAVILFFITSFKICQSKTYNGYHLITITPRKMDQLKYLDSLETQKYMDFKFWAKPHRLGTPVQMIVSPTDISVFRERADHFNLDYTVLMTDLQKAFDNQKTVAYENRRADTFSFEHYHVLEDIYQWLNDIANNSSYCGSHASIGKSTEGRDIAVYNINIKGTKKPKVIVEGGIHGHEWASIVFVTYLINELARAEKSYYYSAWKKLAQVYDWYLIPVANPDGYEYTHRMDRLWRKNRKHLNKTFGVDLNRNFDESWGKYSSSKNPDHDNYCGPSPFSEVETQAMSAFISAHQDLKYYFSFHAYGQKIIVPYEDTVLHMDNFDEMENYSRQVVRKLFLKNHVKYTTGTMYDTTGTRLSGTSASWVKKHMKAKYAYTILLRDNGTYGYALPDSELRPMCTETSMLLQELMTAKPRYVRTLYGDDANISAPDLFTILGVTMLIIIVLYFWTCESKRYDGYELLRGIPVKDEHLEFLKNVTVKYGVDVWQRPGKVKSPVDFIVSPEYVDIVKTEARRLKVPLETLNNNIQSAFDNLTVDTYSRRDMTSFTWNTYYGANDIYAWMTDLSNKYPKEITVFDIGKTIEGRSIKALKMVLGGSKRRSSVIIEGGIHAREWIGPAMVTYLINQLIQAGKTNSGENELTEIAYNYEWHFVPVLNVDGYEYSHTKDHMWRKNRRGGYGVDVNRNFDAAYGTVGVTRTKKNSQEYCGTYAFSEPEAQHMKNFVHSVNSKLPLSHYVAFHSYGQLFIIPYSYSKQHQDNYDEMKEIGDRARERIKKRYGTKYTIGTAFDTLGYMASGVSACWAKKAYSIPYVAVFELRDEGKYGFALPPSLILDTCKETMDGLLEVFKPRSKYKLGTVSPGRQSRIVLNGFIIIFNIFLSFLFF